MVGAISKSVKAEQLRTALVRSLLADVDPDDSLLRPTLVFVDERLVRIGGLARLAVMVVERLLSAAFALAAGTSCADSRRTKALLNRLAVTTLPVLGDYVRLVRSLVLVFVYETRPPLAEKRGAGG
jgi:hypothetical protein